MELVQNTLRVWTPRIVSDAVSSMCFLTHYSEITRGVISLDSIVFFVSIIAFALFANAIAVGQKKSA
jgi:ABC-2 type transport system permease protein